MSRVAVVTGASAGIGRASAIEFARQGWRVALLARASGHLQDAVAEVGRYGPAMAVPVDIAEADQVEAAAAEVEARWGRIDCWVNNAMVTVFSSADAIEPDELRRVTDVCYHGAVWGTQAALRRMERAGRGSIVQVGSALAYRSIPLQAAYCAAKSALRGYTDALRSELIHRGSPVRLTMVHLAAFNTPQFDWAATRCRAQPRPVGPIFQPKIAADAIVTAATGRRREWWVGAPAVKAILGQQVVAGLLDRKLADTAWEGQLDRRSPGPVRSGNLWQSRSGAYRAEGRFGKQARSISWQWLLSKHRNRILAAGAMVAALAAAGTASVLRWSKADGQRKRRSHGLW